MKKTFRSFTAIMLAVAMMVLMIPIGMISASAAYNYLFPVNNGGAIAYGYGYSASYGAWHDGIDIHSSGDDTIYAACDGVVEATANSCYHVSCGYQCEHYNTYGNYIRIGNSDGMKAYYGHLKQNSLLVSVGQSVKRGQPIATMGSSGYSTGKHLHFELRASDYSTKINTNPTSSGGEMNYSYSGHGNTGNNPQGVVDGISGGAGTVTISGWAFDRDDLNAALEIHVYIGGASGDSNAEGHGGIIANVGRGDVNAVYGCGDYHGFSATISTNKRGNQQVYVYALNVGSGENVQIGEGIVNITSSDQPQITALYLSEKKKDSYRVCVQIDRPADVWEVRVATWTTGDQSDLKWTYASYNGYGTYFVDLLRSDFTNNQRYINHVYVYDYSGNSYSTAIDMNYTPPVISNVVISQVSTRGIRVSCKVEGETNITRVSFPTWPAVNGNPIWHEADNLGNGYFTTYIFASEHNNPQSMAFHIYAYDAYGSEIAWGTGSTQITDEPMEFSSIVHKNNKYIFYNTALSWEDANKWCEDIGGHLVTINDKDEWDAVSDLLKQANGARCWLGANSKNGDWKWVTGEEITFDVWDSGQPDNAGGTEYYLGTYSSNTALPERSLITCYNWNDYSSEYMAGFVCEFDDYYKIGDTNRNNFIDICDVTAIQRHLVEIEPFTEEQLAVADTNGDGEINIEDATHLQMYLAKYDVKLG